MQVVGIRYQDFGCLKVNIPIYKKKNPDSWKYISFLLDFHYNY